MFAIGFAAGSAATFAILGLFGNAQQRNPPDRRSRDRDELERYYWTGYKQGVEDERVANLNPVDQLPISKN